MILLYITLLINNKLKKNVKQNQKKKYINMIINY
jgi:hypothetical protein